MSWNGGALLLKEAIRVRDVQMRPSFLCYILN